MDKGEHGVYYREMQGFAARIQQTGGDQQHESRCVRSEGLDGIHGVLWEVVAVNGCRTIRSCVLTANWSRLLSPYSSSVSDAVVYHHDKTIFLKHMASTSSYYISLSSRIPSPLNSPFLADIVSCFSIIHILKKAPPSYSAPPPPSPPPASSPSSTPPPTP